MKKKLFACLLLAAVVLVFSACGTSSQEPEKAPDFEFLNLQGQVVKLSDYTGNPIYMYYWASWCPICLEGMEELNTLAGEDNDFTVLTMVAPGANNEMGREDFISWFAAQDHSDNIPVVFDQDGLYMQDQGVRGFPTSQWIDAEGNVIKTQPGHVSNEEIKAIFKEAE